MFHFIYIIVMWIRTVIGMWILFTNVVWGWYFGHQGLWESRRFDSCWSWRAPCHQSKSWFKRDQWSIESISSFIISNSQLGIVSPPSKNDFLKINFFPEIYSNPTPEDKFQLARYSKLNQATTGRRRPGFSNSLFPFWDSWFLFQMFPRQPRRP